MSNDSQKKPRRRRRWLKRLLVLAVLGVVLWLGSSYAVAYRLTRRPHPLAPEPVPALPWAADVRAFRLATTDHQDLGAWFVPGPADRPDRPAVLLLHGNGARRGACVAEAELLHDAGSPVLMVTHRAHGDSTGDVNDIGFSARRDVVAAVEWLEQNQPGRPVVLWGQSLGAAAGLFAVEELGSRVRGYVLECPYRDLRTAVRNRLDNHLPPVLDRVADAGLSLMAPLVLPDIDRISPLEASANVPPGTPVLILAGGNDTRARPDEARAIAERIGPRADFVLIEKGGHLELLKADPERCRRAVLDLLERCQSRGGS